MTEKEIKILIEVLNCSLEQLKHLLSYEESKVIEKTIKLLSESN